MSFVDQKSQKSTPKYSETAGEKHANTANLHKMFEYVLDAQIKFSFGVLPSNQMNFVLKSVKIHKSLLKKMSTIKA